MAPSGDDACSYDVFISFCGEDTRNSFTDHLYHRLVQEGIRTFRDNEGINKGGELKSEFEGAIKDSRASIVVLSKNYATSTWCLDELLLILEQREECGRFVLPVFYDVAPTEVRNQRGSFAIEVKPFSNWSDDKVSKWKTALTDVANLAGYVVSGPETCSLEEIVGMIINELDLKEVYLPPNLIAMATHDEVIKSWLYQFDLPFFVIIGMGGIGKTTLAKYMYTSHKRSYDYVSFIGDVGSKCERGNDGVLEVQEQLLKDLLGGKARKIPCVSRGTPMIEDALKTKKALIVLDDIDGETQFVDLLGTGTVNPLSKIIITTTKNPDSWRDFPHLKHRRYLMRSLNDEESSELLCLHAFRSKIPNEGFYNVLLRAIKYCGGNPLALEVLGSSLFKNDSLEFWESQLSLFGKDMDSRIENVLKKSYDSLPSNTVKYLFLHIACFFNGIDIDYVEKITEPDYSAKYGIKTLINRCLISISPNKKLMMHRLIQDMGKNIVRQESTQPAKRSRVWHSEESYMILKRGRGSKTVEGLALDMKMLKEEITFKSSQLQTDALNNMDSLKLLQLKFVELNGSYESISKNLRWFCWFEFHLKTIPSELYMANLVAIDMSYSKLEVFEPPEVLRSLQILNLKDSHNLSKISNIFNIPRLETLILWNCHNLVNVCEKLGDLTNLNTLNMSGCKNLFNREKASMLAASTSGGVVTKQPTIPFPVSLHRLFLKDCNLDCTDSFPLSFSAYRCLQYLNLGNSLFESLPYYDHLKDLRVLDLSFCSSLRCLLSLPSTLAELYVYYCESLERITFQSPRFNLQEIGYEGCVNLYEVEGFFKLLPIANLDETDLGHMNWLQGYQNQQVSLVGDDELTQGRSWQIQMLYEFEIMSASIPDIVDPNMKPEHESKSSSLSFDVPPCPINKRLNGINVTFKYELLGDDWVWFCKISTTNGAVDLMYNPKVFGKAESGKLCIWLSYWPIGDNLKAGDTVDVSIVGIKGMKVHECGVSLVYSSEENLGNEMRWEEILGGDLSGFQLSTGGHYLCRRDFHELMEVDGLGPDWLTVLIGHNIDYTEVRGWRKTGRPKHLKKSFTEIKIVRCIIHGPQFEDIYNIAAMTKSSIGDKSLTYTSSLLKGDMNSGNRSELIDEAQEEEESEGMYKVLGSNEIEECDSPPHVVRLKSVVINELSGHGIKGIVLEVNLSDQTKIREMMKALSVLEGIESIDFDKGEGNLTVMGNVDHETLVSRVRKIVQIDYSSVGPASEILAEHERITISATGEGGQFSSSAPAHSQTFRHFSFEEIKSSTRNFEDGLILGRGSHKTVYKGQIYSKEGSHIVAIKRLDSRSYEVEVEFRAEIDTLLKVNHRHLVSLIGYCDDNNEKILVYEDIPNGSLYDHLHERHTSLSWVTRLKIAIGVARGLEYLHYGVRFSHGVVHRNVKSATILLDENWEAVISGFGLSVISPTNEDVQDSIKGTIGYLDTEYLLTGRLTRKVDVYSFGVVLFELLSGRHAIDRERRGDQYNLVEWAKKRVKKGKLDQLVDSRIKEMISTKCLRRFTKIAYRCVHNSSENRPAMTEVTASLAALLEQHQKLKKVAFARKVYSYFVRVTRPMQCSSMTSIGCKGEDCSRNCLRYCFLAKATFKKKQD